MSFEELKSHGSGNKTKLERFLRFSKPLVRKFGRGSRKCRICGRHDGVINKYGLMFCRQCFRENAKSVGFKKY